MIDMKKYIKNIIESYRDEPETIIVLKGIDIKLLRENFTVDIEQVIENKFKYFSNIVQSGRKVIIYDEYLALYNFILTQYKKIVILKNNIFINYYPFQVKLSEQQLTYLMNHYDDEKEGDKYEIGDITELTHIYGNIKLINGNYYISYNNIVSNEKEQLFDIFKSDNSSINREERNYINSCYEIIDEEDYLNMLDDIMYHNKTDIYILENNTKLSNIPIEDKIKILKYIWQSNINIKIINLVQLKKESKCRKEFSDILKKYWGYDKFRRIKVYNLNKLNHNKKSVEEISQNNIITNIVEETEKCMQKKDYRDIFVTAPTGSGKSLIFQIPAIYLAEKYELFTIVISPLIGLMKDQVYNLELHNYNYARTINSDISPIKKQEIIDDIADKKCNILYISPESLLSKSDLEQIIGDRILGLLVVDEAHIVTTWGKQFRPDYWYLGDHLSKLKKSQLKKRKMGFVIATFTATAIYGGIENMYEETIESLKMLDPITYLGYVKREDIDINIKKAETVTGKTEYELNKFEQLINKMIMEITYNKKILIYFPTVALLNRFYEYCSYKNLDKYVSIYHGQLSAYEKEENYEKFLYNETLVMLATKAFGMGIDIDDIQVVAHFAPTGNVCDYVQEIGRAARKPGLTGEAYYVFMKGDFKHINRLHGLSTIKDYQLVELISKVYELYQENLKNIHGKKLTKKRNEMLVDAENFAHIFENPFYNEDDGINKVKTAMLLIQKDFERIYSFSPFVVRPIPLFELGYFQIDPITQKNLKTKYGSILDEVDSLNNICSVNLKKIWEYSFYAEFSFPKFKYMIYTRDPKFNFEYKDIMKPAIRIEINFQDNYLQKYENCISALKRIINKSIREEKFYDVDGENGLVEELMKLLSINKYKAKSIAETILSAMSVYQRDYNNNLYSKVYMAKQLNSGNVKYKFLRGSVGFFSWIDNGFNIILEKTINEILYLIDNTGNKGFKETLLILGILETLDILVFKSLGGSNSQLYIYVNETKTMREIIDKPWRYKNRLVELISERHDISVEMLTYLFEGEFTSNKIWNYIEDYFLGIIPDPVLTTYEKK